MKDRFKFRFFETYNNTMLDCDDYDINELFEEGKPVMQCTGLKDKNGKLVYESDIVTDGIENYVVVWIDDDDHLGFYVRDLDKVNYTFYQLLEYTIIGNIYENKELLED